MPPILITPYNPQWPIIFLELKEVYHKLLGNLVLDIQHVGSTSVPGLAAKPVLDIDLIIDDRTNFPTIVQLLEGIGYVARGEMGVPDREAFQQLDLQVPRSDDGKVWNKHNLYVCIAGSVNLSNHLLLRDYLRANPTVAREYGAIKMSLAKQFPNDIDSYVDGKTDFILSILKQSGLTAPDLKSIEQINKKA